MSGSRALHPVVMFSVAEGEPPHRRNQHCRCLSFAKAANPEVAIYTVVITIVLLLVHTVPVMMQTMVSQAKCVAGVEMGGGAGLG